MEEEKNDEKIMAAESDTEESINNHAYVNSEPDYSLWKQVILLHTRVVWKNIIIIATVAIQFQLILYDISFRGRTAFSPQSNDLKNEKIFMDCVFVFDVISAIIYKKWTSLSSTYGQPARPIASLVLDVISILPIDLIYRLVARKTNVRVSYFLSTNHLLRIHRVFSFFNATRNSVGQRRVFIRVVEFLMLLFLITGVAVAAMINTVDMVNLDVNWLKIITERSSYPANEFEWCIISYYVMMTQISGHGLPEALPGIYSFAFIVIVLVSLWMLQGFEIAYLTDIILQRDYDRSLFHREMHLIVKYLEDMNASKGIREKVKKYCNYFWKKQRSSEFRIMKFNMYPTIFLKECALELAWDAYKHSHLFHDQPIPFLRDLAVLFEREYYRPGEVIFHKYERKSKLIYIVTGVVQLLSEEDDQSPILSLSGGTTLCESTLILSHRSLCNVVACTEVELNVLHRDKFVELMVHKYQDIYRIIQSRVRLRYWKALRLVTIGAALQKNKSHIVTVPACTDVAWLKHTLTILQNRSNRMISKRERKDMQLETVFTTTDFRYTFANLDMLVISDDIAIMTEQVCLNNGKIPWIFYPQSTILKYWKGFVLICCFALTLIIPAYVTQPGFQDIELTFAIHILCSVYFVDLIITSSTAIRENDVVHTNIIDIISRRMYNVSYWADVVAAFPVDWILVTFGSRDTKLLAYCKINRLVKMYKFEGFFSSVENWMILSSYNLRVIKYTFYMAILSYLSSACILLQTCPNGQCESSEWLQTFIDGANDDMKGKFVTSAFLYASQVIVGIGTDVIVPKTTMEYFISIPFLIIGAAVLNYVISSVTACQILSEFTKSWLRFNTMNIALMLNLNKVTKSIQSRVFRYLEMEWLENNVYVLTFERQMLDRVTPKLRKELNAERLAFLVKEVELFQDMEEECIKEICSICKLILLPPREVVGYRGNECREMYIVEKGYCQIWRNVDMTPLTVTIGKAFYVVEMFCNLKNLHTVTTVTHVSVVQIKLKDLMLVLSQFPVEETILTKIVKKFKKSSEFTRLVAIQTTLPKQNMMMEIEKKWHQIDELAWVTTNPKSLASGRKKADNVSEETSWKQTVLMVFLFKSTINPDGRFIKIWEGVRCTSAYLLIILYSADAVLSQIIPKVLRIVLRFALNSMMVIDLYIRLHVQFYNSHRILVTHPLSTAKNYIYSGLVVDILAVFPFEYFFISEDPNNPKRLWFCRLNRLLMTHRITAALRHHYSWPYMFEYTNCVMFIPIIILIGHVFACGFLHEICELGGHIKESENFVAGIYCSPKNVVVRHKLTKLITPMQMYIYSTLYVFATLTRIGAVNLRPVKYTAIIYVLVMTLVSFLLLLIITTYTISTISRRDATLTAYQEQMMILMSYLKENKVSIEFRDEVVNYFENFWILRRGTSIMNQMRLFPPALQEDVLWSVYGPSLTKSPGFSKRNESFFRSLFNHMQVKFYSKGSEIMRVNLVHRLVYFIHWGWAEAFGPDGTRIAVLGSGSIFGNFTSSATMRQTCSIVTRTHVEALAIESTDFFDLMMCHPQTKKNFLATVALSSDYLKANTEAEEVEVVSQTKKKPTFILLPNTALVQSWEIFSVIFSCYLAFALCIYSIAITSFTGYWLILLYTVDLAFLVKIILVFFTAFEDDLGDYVVDKIQIAKREIIEVITKLNPELGKPCFRFRESKFGLYLHVFTTIPFEVLCFCFSDVDTKQDAFAWLRVNRVPRLILIINYFRIVCNRLNINISRMRIYFAVIMFLSLLHVAACLMAVVEKATNDNTTYLEGLRIYLENFYTVSVMFTVISSRVVPKNTQEAAYVILLFLVFYVAHALLLGEVCAVVDVSQFIMNEYERRLTFFRERVTRMDLTYVLRMNSWSYGSKLWKVRSGQQTPQLIREAPVCLQYAVSYEMYAHHLLGNEIFGNLHEDFIRQLTFHFKVNVFFPGDTIVNVDDVDETIYFIDKGTVNVSALGLNVPEEHRLLRTLGPAECFGIVQGLYERIPHTATYIAKTTTHIVSLHRPDWVYLLKYFPVTTLHLYKSATKIIRSSGLEAYT